MSIMQSYRYVCFDDAEFDENYIWVVNDTERSVCRINRTNLEVESMLSLVNEKIKHIYWYFKILDFNNVLYLLPHTTEEPIGIYDKNSNKVEYVPFEAPYKYQKPLFLDAIIQGEVVVFFPRKLYLPLIKFHLKTHKYEYDIAWSQQLRRHMNKGDEWFVGLTVVGATVWMTELKYSIVVETDLKNGKITLHTVGEGKFHLGKIAFDGELFWISIFNKYAVLSWNPKINSTNMYILGKEVAVETKMSVYIQIICADQKVFLLPSFMRHIQMVDKSLGIIKELDTYPKGFSAFENHGKKLMYTGYKIVKNQLWIFPQAGNMLLIVDLRTLNIIGHILLAQEEKNIYELWYQSPNSVTVENIKNEIHKLNNLCRLINFADETDEGYKLEDKEASGEKIWKEIKIEL